ncbi:MAG: undecaprenyl-diphosphate phosphatase [Bacteroidetes bacterium]|nr:undecaprenyl-diphosphate phosphatase [Bacteroidota bacterium]
MTYFQAIIIAIIQGITEFLPISSTGHMIIAETLLGLKSSEFTNVFAVCIHFGTILSVIILYWKRFFKSLTLYYKLFIAFIPAAIAGLLLDDFISATLLNVFVVAVSLLLGGIVLLFVDKWFSVPNDKSEEPSYPSAFKIGLFQIIAMIPGVSRSAATIIGGMTQKLSRKNAAEFSFLLAVPTIIAASGYKLIKSYSLISSSNINIIIIGNIVAFIIAFIAIKTFIGYIQKHGFKIFGYYRIILGIIILVLLACGVDFKIGLD